MKKGRGVDMVKTWFISSFLLVIWLFYQVPGNFIVEYFSIVHKAASQSDWCELFPFEVSQSDWC